MKQTLVLLAVSLCLVAGSYDIFVFDMQWKPGICTVNSCTSGFESQNFGIHGLWPSYSSGSNGPAFCSNSHSFSISSAVEAKLDKYWSSYSQSNTGFWEHEWNKHGSCVSSSETPDDYFSEGINLFLTLDPLNILAQGGVYPGTRSVGVKDFYNAFINKINISCREKGGTEYFTELQVCYSKDYQLIDCEEQSTNCGGSFVFAADN